MVDIIQNTLDLFALPFMQRALMGGILTGLLGGLLGSFALLRNLAFFSDALGHSALLGLVIGLLVGLDPDWILLPFAVTFGLGVTWLLERTQLETDAILNIVYSSSLALAVIGLTYADTYRGSLTQLLFGDLLGINPMDLWLSGGMLTICVLVLGLSLKSQMLISLHEPLAIAQGVSTQFHRWLFISLLSLFVGLSIQSVGVLLVSAFIVIPACTARLLTQHFTYYVPASMAVGGLSAVGGMVGSAALNWPSGPSIVASQLGFFLIAVGLATFKDRDPSI